MESRQLGRDGPYVPVLFLGTWPLGGGMGPVPRKTALDTIRRALDLGIRAIDTAEGYGNAEELVGEALEASDRATTFIATKVSFGPYTASRVRDAVEQSLRRLGTDQVDLLQLHFYPSGVALEEALDALWAVREAGLTQFVGVSNFTREQLQDAATDRMPQAIQAPLNLFDREELTGAIGEADRMGMGVICHSTLAKGLLTGGLSSATAFEEADERSRHPRFADANLSRFVGIAQRLETLAGEAGLGLVELAVAWVVAQTGVTACICGPRSMDELDAQVRGAHATVSATLLDRARAIAAQAPSIAHGTPTESPTVPAGA